MTIHTYRYQFLYESSSENYILKYATNFNRLAAIDVYTSIHDFVNKIKTGLENNILQLFYFKKYFTLPDKHS